MKVIELPNDFTIDDDRVADNQIGNSRAKNFPFVLHLESLLLVEWDVMNLELLDKCFLIKDFIKPGFDDTMNLHSQTDDPILEPI